MKLYEFEGHRILAKSGIESPFFIVCENAQDVKEARKRLKFPLVCKVQVLSGKRGKAGGIKTVANEKQLNAFCEEMFGASFSGEEVKYIALAEKAAIENEYYFSITYDTGTKAPFLIFSFYGGMDIEEVKEKNSEAVVRVEIDPVLGPLEKDLKRIFGKDGSKLIDVVMRAWDAFCRYDCRLVEINPLAKVGNPPRFGEAGKYLAIDAKIILDDNGLSRHKDIDILPKGAVSALPTEREILAKQIDSEDYRGSAGSTFIEFDGDIAVLASGGGASLLIMDALIENGGRPANYTEYSGNPPGEKVEKLTEITLSKEGLSGCLVAGAVANFTDIYDTLSGFCRGLKKIKPKADYPIVIRRGGPRQEEAYKMLSDFSKKEGFDIHLFGPETPISVAAKKMVELSQKYRRLK